MKKYFDFNGTINGTNYFLRGLVAAIPAVIANAIFLGGVDYSASGGEAGLALLAFFAVLIPIVVLNLSTLNKRLNALMPDNKILGWVLCFIPFVSWIMSLYLLFANSNIEDHNG